MKDLEKEKPDWKKKKREKLSTSDYKCAAKGRFWPFTMRRKGGCLCVLYGDSNEGGNGARNNYTNTFDVHGFCLLSVPCGTQRKERP